ncbi:unnamed protein product [Amoebophrya sp. A120]|nr:unnamed protein product [Amoebophrya sp. A120]|eukprot:GSA120T00003854001.1
MGSSDYLWRFHTLRTIWQGRSFFGTAVLKVGDEQEQMVLFGGVNGKNEYLNDVWTTKDLWSWEKLDFHRIWKPRAAFATVLVEGNKILLLGGRGEDGKVFKDVWLMEFEGVRNKIEKCATFLDDSSSSGKDIKCTATPVSSELAAKELDRPEVARPQLQPRWRRVTTRAPWEARSDFAVAVLEQKRQIILHGGRNQEDEVLDDVWVADISGLLDTEAEDVAEKGKKETGVGTNKPKSSQQEKEHVAAMKPTEISSNSTSVDDFWSADRLATLAVDYIYGPFLQEFDQDGALLGACGWESLALVLTQEAMLRKMHPLCKQLRTKTK